MSPDGVGLVTAAANLVADSTTNAALISAFGVVIAAGVGYLGVRIQKVHVMVNSQRTEMMRRIDQLAATLQAAGVKIPEAPVTIHDATVTINPVAHPEAEATTHAPTPTDPHGDYP